MALDDEGTVLAALISVADGRSRHEFEDMKSRLTGL